MSYVTGSHNVKVGTQWTWGQRRTSNYFWGAAEDIRFNGLSEGSAQLHQYTDVTYTFRNGSPNSVNYFIPTTSIDRVRLNLGTFVQDQWTVNRLTLNLGARFDYLNGYIPAQHVPASKWVGARDYPDYDNLPNWKDIAPRLGASYDSVRHR